MCFYVGVISAIFFRASFPLSVLLYVPSADSVMTISLLTQRFNESEQNWTQMLLILPFFSLCQVWLKINVHLRRQEFLEGNKQHKPTSIRSIEFQPGTL